MRFRTRPARPQKPNFKKDLEEEGLDLPDRLL
jgi:hypothetical protein